MTLEELNQLSTSANWLIAKRSAGAAGKALTFDLQSVEAFVVELSQIYGLTEDEVARLNVSASPGKIAGVQSAAKKLLGDVVPSSSDQAATIVKAAIQNGKTAATVMSFVKAGPAAAQAAAAGGAVASKGTPWGWIATAAFAAGSAGWFAYNARALNVAAYEIVRQREGIEVALPLLEQRSPDSGPGDDERVELNISLPSPKAVAAKAARLGGKAGAFFSGTFRKLKT